MKKASCDRKMLLTGFPNFSLYFKFQFMAYFDSDCPDYSGLLQEVVAVAAAEEERFGPDMTANLHSSE